MNSKQENVKQRIARYDFAFLFLFLLIVAYFVYQNLQSDKEEVVDKEQLINVSVTCPHHVDDSLSLENLERLLIDMHVEHPKIVMAQIRLESGNLQSKLTKENNNFLGMKYPAQRPTTSIGEKNGYAEYLTWRDCAFDYLIWQSRYAKKLSEEEYYKYLSSVYAEDKNYINKLKQIANE